MSSRLPLVAALRRIFFALILAAHPAAAHAQPPTLGSVHRFQDPIFNGTVFCDTLDQIREIATSETPNTIYAMYRVTLNAVREPVCMAIVPTATVVSVTDLGVMVRDGSYFKAWAVEAQVGSARAFALYLEPCVYV